MSGTIVFVEFDAVGDKPLGFFIDASLCSGCKACQVACKDKNDLEAGRNFRRVHEVAQGGFEQSATGAYDNNVDAFCLSIACNHCEVPVCADNCPTKAMHKRPGDGIVRVDTDRCIGCEYCAWSCPYGAPQIDHEAGRMSKCDFCIDVLAGGSRPACVDACPLHVIEFGAIDDLRARHGALSEVEGMPPAPMTAPNLVIKPHRSVMTEQSNA